MSQAAAEADILAYHNARRSEAGLPAFTRAPCADAIASNWTVKMASDGHISHRPDLGDQITARCGAWQAIGENVAAAQSAAALNAAWWGSAPHRANILDANYTHVGISVWRAPNGILYSTVNFYRLF